MTHFDTLGLFEKKISDVFWKLYSMGLRERFFFKKFKLFPCYSDLELKFLGLLAEKSYQCGQTSVRCAQRYILRRTMPLPKILFVFQTSSEKRSDNGKHYWLRSLDGILAVQGNVFSGERRNILRITLFHKKTAPPKTFENGNFLDAFCTLQFPWLKQFFWSLFLTFGELFCQLQTFSNICSKCLPKLLSMSPEDRSMIFGPRANIFRAFGQKVSSGVSKLHSTCPKKRHFKEEHFLEQTDGFSFQIRTLNWNILDFCRKNSGRVAKFAFEQPKGTFWGEQGVTEGKLLLSFSDFER